jgi:hypothetical protein
MPAAGLRPRARPRPFPNPNLDLQPNLIRMHLFMSVGENYVGEN